MLRNYVILYILRHICSLKNFCKGTPFSDTDKFFFYLVEKQAFLFAKFDEMLVTVSSCEVFAAVAKTVDFC